VLVCVAVDTGRGVRVGGIDVSVGNGVKVGRSVRVGGIGVSVGMDVAVRKAVRVGGIAVSVGSKTTFVERLLKAVGKIAIVIKQTASSTTNSQGFK